MKSVSASLLAISFLAALLVAALPLVTPSAPAQTDKPRVFVAGRGSLNATSTGSAAGDRHFVWGASSTTVDAHDESMEVAKDLGHNCAGVLVSVNRKAADYIVSLDRESKKNRGLLRTNSQVMVVNRLGDMIQSGATHTVSNAAKDACDAILADWAKNGRLTEPSEPPDSEAQQPEAQPPAPAQVPVNALVPTSAGSETVTDEQARAARNTVVFSAEGDEISLAEQAKRAKQHIACLKLAADNPSITCK